MTVKGKYGGRKVRDGTVVSDKMLKTVLVAVEQHIRHPLYKKRVRRVRRLMAHDELLGSRLGDRVRIIEAAPISRHKRWRVLEVLERAELPEVAAESIDLDLLGEVRREEEEPVAEAESSEAVAAAGETTETIEAAETGDTEETIETAETSEEPAPPEAEELTVEEVAETEPQAEDFEDKAEATAEEVAVATGESAEDATAAEGAEEPPESEEEKA